ncbi:GNAT family N-acetyltransferase [Chitinophaga nivalis]|uniref:GNAT family N-acetyltransferase n=1 Tax=Chitinophaga nivalis TaxID=2991709 RepID=A0ABT3ISE2_9BACT|nr:GNAT family N-acetyltransferase [Chitinophaga nivalis]MCW3463424.1 GNAT family N-acetyltransferase [Chitinophaga nivalis]MCW3486886.1 GNAT family N-acetyltransferase [Chitinophaga nivalis]
MITITPIRIREHYTVMLTLLEALHVSEQEFFPNTANWKDIATDYMAHVMEMQETCDGACLMAYDGDIPAGFIFAYTEEPDESRIEAYTGNTLYVSDGYVVPAYRRQGIYQQLNEALENSYIKKGIRRIVRYTLANNHRMQAFLASKAYTPVRLVYEKWLSPDGTESLPLFPPQ